MLSLRKVQFLVFVCLKHYLKMIKLPGQCNQVNVLAFSDQVFSYGFCYFTKSTSKSPEELKKRESYSQVPPRLVECQDTGAYKSAFFQKLSKSSPGNSDGHWCNFQGLSQFSTDFIQLYDTPLKKAHLSHIIKILRLRDTCRYIYQIY